MHVLSSAIFWAAGGLLAYTFAGYGLLMRLLARARPPLSSAPAPFLPPVCVVLIAHNEATRLPARLENLLATEYPPERLSVIVVSDGSTDTTAETARGYCAQRVSVLEWPERRGKAAGLNAALAAATAEFIVFADARQRFAPGTIARLVSHFAEPRIGAVSGSLQIERAASGVGRGIDLYWRGEKSLRAAEARWDSCIGCTGAVYAIRRALFAPLPADTLLDDVVVPMRIALQGYRVLHDEAAIAYDPQALEPALERIRKHRTLAGNFQMLFRHPAWLLPWRNRLWLQLISHKYLRLTGPLALTLLLTANVALLGSPIYRLALAAQVLCYALALLAPARSGVLALPAGFVLLNVAVCRAFVTWLRGRHHESWQPPRAQPPGDALGK